MQSVGFKCGGETLGAVGIRRGGVTVVVGFVLGLWMSPISPVGVGG
jgi:hypothetical protein